MVLTATKLIFLASAKKIKFLNPLKEVRRLSLLVLLASSSFSSSLPPCEQKGAGKSIAVEFLERSKVNNAEVFAKVLTAIRSSHGGAKVNTQTPMRESDPTTRIQCKGWREGEWVVVVSVLLQCGFGVATLRLVCSTSSVLSLSLSLSLSFSRSLLSVDWPLSAGQEVGQVC